MTNITGVEEAERILKEYPFEAEKIVKKATRAAGNVMRRRIRAAMPKASFKKAVTLKIESKKTISAKAGLFGKARGSEIPVFFKAYWLNYGTLRGRNPSHRFANGIKRRGNIANGIRYRGFFEKGTANMTDELERAFIDSIDKQTNDNS